MKIFFFQSNEKYKYIYIIQLANYQKNLKVIKEVTKKFIKEVF